MWVEVGSSIAWMAKYRSLGQVPPCSVSADLSVVSFDGDGSSHGCFKDH